MLKTRAPVNRKWDSFRVVSAWKTTKCRLDEVLVGVPPMAFSSFSGSASGLPVTFIAAPGFTVTTWERRHPGAGTENSPCVSWLHEQSCIPVAVTDPGLQVSCLT